MRKPVTYEVALLRRELSILWLTVTILVAGLGLVVQGFRGDGWALVGGLLLSWLGSAWTSRNLTTRAKITRVPGVLRVEETAIWLDDEALVERRSLRAALLTPTPEGALLRLESAWPYAPIDLQLRRQSDGLTVLEELGFAASHAAVRFRLGSRAGVGRTVENAGMALFGCVVIAGGVLIEWAARHRIESLVPWAIAAAVVALWFALSLVPTSVVVGADGLFIRWLWSRRFVRFADVRDVGPQDAQAAGTSIGILLADGAGLRYSVRSGFADGSSEEDRARVVARIRQALAVYRKQPPAGEVRLPQRGTRPVAEWIRALRGSGSAGAADHRTAPVPTEELWRVAEDLGAENVSRAAAAVALAAGLDAAGKQRLRIAAAATAAPELRAVLDASAAEADEEQLSQALSRLTRE